MSKATYGRKNKFICLGLQLQRTGVEAVGRSRNLRAHILSYKNEARENKLAMATILNSQSQSPVTFFHQQGYST